MNYFELVKLLNEVHFQLNNSLGYLRNYEDIDKNNNPNWAMHLIQLYWEVDAAIEKVTSQ